MKAPESDLASLTVADLRQRARYIQQRQVIIGRIFAAAAIGAAGWTAFELATEAFGWTTGIGAGVGSGFLAFQYLLRRIPGL